MLDEQMIISLDKHLDKHFSRDSIKVTSQRLREWSSDHQEITESLVEEIKDHYDTLYYVHVVQLPLDEGWLFDFRRRI